MAMATQAGVSLSKILILAGAGYTGTILLKNGKLSDLLGELQLLVKGLEQTGDESGSDSEYAEAIAAQVRRLAMEVRQLASARQVTVFNGNSGQIGNISSLIVPAATLGAVGYGYMWWKGLAFSDFMYVTKRSMSGAVSNLTKHLEGVSETLSAAKRHLTQRIERLDDKMEQQKELSKRIKGNVEVAQKSLHGIEFSLEELQSMVSRVDNRIGSLETKQNDANFGVYYLCKFVEGNRIKMPDGLMERFELSGKKSELLTNTEASKVKGLKEIADTVFNGLNKSGSDSSAGDGTKIRADLPRTLKRMALTRC